MNFFHSYIVIVQFYADKSFFFYIEKVNLGWINFLYNLLSLHRAKKLRYSDNLRNEEDELRRAGTRVTIHLA